MSDGKLTPTSRPRPLSPHLDVYKPQYTSMTSIFHRATGAFLSIGSVLIVLWLWAAAYNPEYFVSLSQCFASLPGQIILIGFTIAFYYHLANGVRHLVWDAGIGYSLPAAYRSAWMVILFTVVCSALTWVLALG